MSAKKSVSSVEKLIADKLGALNLPIVKRSEGAFTVGDIADLMNSGQWVTDGAFQRSERSGWLSEDFTDSVFDSLMAGIGFGAITINALPDGSYSVIDGAHRSRFIGRALGGSITWRGSRLDDNPALLAAFRAVSVPITEYQALDDSDCAHIFEVLNGGVALSAIEKRRGRIRDLITRSDFSGAVKALQSILPSVAGRAARRETAEEIVIQALAGALGHYDYTGKAVIDFLAGARDKWDSALPGVLANVAALVEYVQADEEKTLKRALKKSWLNVFLAVSELDVNHLCGWVTQWNTSEVESLTEECEKFKGAAGAGSASVSAVSARLEVARVVNSGKYQRGKVKVKPVKTEGAPTTGKGKKKESGKIESPEVQAESSETGKVNKWAAMIAKEFGRGTYSAKEEARIIEHLELMADDSAVLVELKNKSGIVSHWIQSKAGRVSVADVIQRG